MSFWVFFWLGIFAVAYIVLALFDWWYHRPRK